MNSKMIAIIAVVAMCGAALVGVGYAYTSTYTDSGSGDVGAEYVDISGGWTAVNNQSVFKYDTSKTGVNNSVKTLTLSDGKYDTVWTVSESTGKIIATLSLGTVTFEPKGDATVALNQIKVKIGSAADAGLTAFAESATTSTTTFTASNNTGITGSYTEIIVKADKSGDNIALTFSVQITLGEGSIIGDTVTMGNTINELGETWGAIQAQYTKA